MDNRLRPWMGKLQLALGLMEPHLCGAVGTVPHLPYTQQGNGPALVYQHLQLGSSIQRKGRSGDGDGFALLVKIHHALHAVARKLLGSLCLAPIDIHLCHGHHLIAHHRSLAHPQFATGCHGDAVIGRGRFPSAHADTTTDNRLLTLDGTYHCGRL